MTELQIMLALETILCAAEGKFGNNQDLLGLLARLEAATDEVITDNLGDESFDKLLTAQREAVQALIDNPAVFGHDPK